MLLISKVIRTVDDYAAWVKIAIACENNGKTEGSHNYGDRLFVWYQTGKLQPFKR